MNQKRNKIFFGWWVVIACFFISTSVTGVIVYGFTTIIQPLVAEFGWSYTEISFAASLQSLIMGLSAPIVGIMVDRWQPSRVIFSGILINCLGLILLSSTTSLGMFYLAFMLLSIGFGFTIGTPLMAIVVKWFRQNVATAAGIVASGFAMGGLLIAPITLLVDTFGWRLAMVALGIGMLIIPLPLSLFIQRKPQDMVDSKSSTLHLDAAKQSGYYQEIIRILKSRAFWQITIALTLQFIVINAVVVHIMPYFVSIGISRSDASLIASFMTVTGICGRLGFGWLGDRYNISKVTLITLILLTIGIFFYSLSACVWIWFLVPFFILFGFGWGGQVTLTTALLNEQFGRNKFGTTFGMYFSIMELGGMAGPLMAGWVYDTLNSYQVAWFISVGLAIISVIVLATAPFSDKEKI